MTPTAAAWSSSGDGPGVLVLHGFTGNPSSMRPLAERIAEAGYRVELPRLPGHGTNWRDLATTTWDDWAGEAVAAFGRLGGGPRAVVGLSAGGALSLYLAEQLRDDVAALVLINPAISFEHPLKPALGLLKRVVPAFPGIGSDIAKPGVDEHAYPRVPLAAAATLFAGYDAVRSKLDRVSAPTLLLTSRVDHTVDPKDSDRIAAGLINAHIERVILERSYHVATIDYDADLIVERTIRWLADTVGTPLADGADAR